MRYIDNNLENYENEFFEDFLLLLYRENYAPKTVNLYYNAIRSFANLILKKDIFVNIERTRWVKRLPIILSKNEIGSIITVLKNKKHRLILALAYGAGLRVSEVVYLKVGDLNFETNTIHIKQSKWNKDRITLLPKKIVFDLLDLLKWKKSQDYVFWSERWWRLTTRTAQKIFKQACHRVWIQKRVSFHSLRHSFATHLLESGLDVTYVQKLLGHSSIKTTQTYLHLANTSLKNIVSPLD